MSLASRQGAWLLPALALGVIATPLSGLRGQQTVPDSVWRDLPPRLRQESLRLYAARVKKDSDSFDQRVTWTYRLLQGSQLSAAVDSCVPVSITIVKDANGPWMALSLLESPAMGDVDSVVLIASGRRYNLPLLPSAEVSFGHGVFASVSPPLLNLALRDTVSRGRLYTSRRDCTFQFDRPTVAAMYLLSLRTVAAEWH